MTSRRPFGRLELVGEDRRARLEGLLTQELRNVEQDAAGDDAVAQVMNAQLDRPMCRHRLRGVAVVEVALMEDVAQRVEVAGGESVRGEGEVVGAVALGGGARHVVGHRGRIVGGGGGVERPGARDPATGPDQRRGRHGDLGRDEVQGTQLIVGTPATPVRQSGVVRRQFGRVHWCLGHGRSVAPTSYDRPMATLRGDYEPSPSEWVRDQVAEYEASGGTRANTLLDTGMPIIVVTSRGAKSGKLRKNPLMRVEHGGAYALVASKGGAPENPEWFYNLVAYPDEVTIQDGPEPFAVAVRPIEGDERALWWERAVAAYPPYAEYQENTDRRIPVFLATPGDAAT